VNRRVCQVTSIFDVFAGLWGSPGHFAAPSLRTFAALVTGLVAQTGKRMVTGMLVGAGLERAWSHDRAHA
jgi:hypothetical protein